MRNCKMYKVDKKIWKRYIARNEMREYYNYRMNQITNTIVRRPYNPIYRKYARHKVLSFSETNDLIRNAILSGTPFWAGRYGMTELRTIIQAVNKELGLNNDLEKQFTALCDLSGFFPDDIFYANDFTQLMFDAYAHIDLHAIWPQFMEDYFIRHQNDKVRLTLLGCLEPWNIARYTDDIANMVELWTTALKGKKVLVVHPFSDTIREQYEKRRCHIFSNLMSAEKILPDFELRTFKAVQTLAGNQDNRFSTWFDALDYMVEECMKIDYDVAIVGCGAYGFPLCREIKNAGKVAIHLGGATQLMFGIIGKRWESSLQSIINEAWTHPGVHENIVNSSRVEDSCYW